MARPLSDQPVKGRSREERNAYMRNYMRQYRGRSAEPVESRPDRGLAIYDPLRDAPLRYENESSQLMGDPPLGRRAIDGVVA